MDVDDIRLAREKLEDDLFKLVIEFTHKTGVGVQSIDIDSFSVVRINDHRAQSVVSRVHVVTERL